MKPEKIISALETTIIRVTRDIKKKQGNTGSDKLDSLAKLANSYSRLLTRLISDSGEKGYYELMNEGKIKLPRGDNIT